jgi:hypothetical protein
MVVLSAVIPLMLRVPELLTDEDWAIEPEPVKIREPVTIVVDPS